MDTHGIHSLLRSFQTRPTFGATSMAARLLACLLAWLVASTLDYLKNRIPPARNCVSRLVFMYQYTLGWNNVGYSAACVHAANARFFAALDFDL